MKATYTVDQDFVGLSAACPVSVFACKWDEAIRIYPHDHEYYEIAVVRRGGAIHQTPTYERPIEPGTAIVVGLDQVHGYDSATGVDITNVYYLAEWLMDDVDAFWAQDGFVPLFFSAELFGRSLLTEVPQFQLVGEDWDAYLRELADLTAEAEKEFPSWLYLKSSLLKLMVVLSRAFVAQRPEDTAVVFRREVWAALGQVERAVTQGESFRVAEAASAAGLSPDHFCRVFKEATGWAPQEYYQRRRVRHARRLLLEPGRPVAQVAARMGFFDAAHFCNVFRRYEGISPNEFRTAYARKDSGLRSLKAAGC